MALDTPRSLRMFLVIAFLMVVFVFANLLTTVSYLYNVVKMTHSFKSGFSRTFPFGHQSLSVDSNHFNPENRSTYNNSLPQVHQHLLPSTTSMKPTSPTTQKPKLATPTNRPEACDACFRHNFRYLLQNEAICRHDENQTIDVIVVIFTVHGNTAARKAIRETWISVSRNNTSNIRYAFLLGDTSNNQTKEAVLKENEIHKDILMEDFRDAYSNLTYKTMMGLKWITQFCSDAKFFMKTDDDMWVNIRVLMKTLNAHAKKLETALGGSCAMRAGPIRDKGSKWYASFKSYPQNSYPGFCSGTGYASTVQLAKKVYEISKNVPFFHLEDVYVSLCIRKLGYTLLPLPGFHNYRTKMDPCDMQSDRIITSHQVPTNFLHKAWDTKC